MRYKILLILCLTAAVLIASVETTLSGYTSEMDFSVEIRVNSDKAYRQTEIRQQTEEEIRQLTEEGNRQQTEEEIRQLTEEGIRQLTGEGNRPQTEGLAPKQPIPETEDFIPAY